MAMTASTTLSGWSGLWQRHRAPRGLVVVLANDASYWRPVTNGRRTSADAFGVREGAVLHGDHRWGPAPGAGTMRAREASLYIEGSYECRWRAYSRLDGRNGVLRDVAFYVPPRQP